MLKENWQWQKAIAGTLSAFTLLVGAGGLTSCNFGRGEQEEADEQINENRNQPDEDDQDNEDGKDND